jgi:predicted CXXCH cytochrome family protein
MRRVLLALVLGLVWVALGASAALADGGPHGGYDRTTTGAAGLTDACAGCHRPHQGQSEGFLLKRATQFELCVTCHNGEGSRLDVLDGVKLGATQSRTPGQTVGGATLNGGGFDFVNGTAITSRHDVRRSTADTGESQPWGYLADTGTKSGTLSQPLTCTSCHNPHGSANYRIFRESINNRTVSVLAFAGGHFTNQEGDARGLETGAPADKYTHDYYGSAGLTDSGGYEPTASVAATAGDPSTNGFALLCGSCHSSYPSSGAKSIPTSNPWGITKYRHRTEMPYTFWNSPKYGGPVPCNPEQGPYNPANGTCSGAGQLPALRLASNTTSTETIVTCTTCHRAHGTASTMTGFALSNAFPGGTSPDAISPAQTSSSSSMLLYTDNRGMCEACHQW